MFGINDIWLLLAIPLLATAWLLFAHLKETKWWELLILWAVCILTIFISQMATEGLMLSDDEVWGFNGVRAQYDERYQRWETCSRTYACGTYSCGTAKSPSTCTRYCTEYYDCKQWRGNVAYLVDQKNGSMRISPARYKMLEAEKWGNTRTQELNRHATERIIVDGERRHTEWPGTWETAEPIAHAKTYENRTQCAATIRFQQVTDEDVENYGLFEYPTFYGGYEVITILDQSGVYPRKADQKWRYLNGIFGPTNKLRMWVLIFRNQDASVLGMQQGYWMNGNKNEFIFVIGADDDGKVQWGDVISWTDVEELKIEARDAINALPDVSEESLIQLGDWAEANMVRYVKPDFTEKYGHLSVQPSMTAMVVVAIVVLLVTVGTCVFVVKNPWVNHPEPRRVKSAAGRRPISPPPPRPRKKKASTSGRRRRRP